MRDQNTTTEQATTETATEQTKAATKTKRSRKASATQDTQTPIATSTEPTTQTEQAKPAKVAKPVPTLAEALETARAANPTRYAHVVRVVSLTKDNTPARVVIACSDPQTKQTGIVDSIPQLASVCDGEREIAVQDLFQVHRCASCADRVVRKARRNRAKTKAKAERQAIRAMRASA